MVGSRREGKEEAETLNGSGNRSMGERERRGGDQRAGGGLAIMWRFQKIRTLD